MAKRFVLTIIFLCIASLLIAGDVATFVDIGFSKDGEHYVFAQYGSTDKTFEGYAEIYTVDIARNEYVEEGVFEVSPTPNTASKSGLEVYKSLYNDHKIFLDKKECETADLKHTIFLRSKGKKNNLEEEIVFKDFERSSDESEIYYHIKLIPWYGGKSKDSESSFFISIQKKDGSGILIEKDVAGNPDIKRKGISNYSIEKILCDSSLKNLIFVVEKKMISDNGISIRYMVETEQLFK